MAPGLHEPLRIPGEATRAAAPLPVLRARKHGGRQRESLTAPPACADLQAYDSDAGVLRIAAQRGFSAEFLTFFATVDGTGPSACAVVLATGEAVLVDVSRSPIFVGHTSRDVVLAAGSGAVYSFPLLAPAGEVAGVLSLHTDAVRPTTRTTRPS